MFSFSNTDMAFSENLLVAGVIMVLTCMNLIMMVCQI
ncbi:MAG: hypothetical protein CM15mP12_3720 [Gammaproteobacteria bacterium]|nr:MAG: hypothetical protein CM15mP12_3720 [Gammaproteobacteria bacterium]